jgi:oxygen-independent coproporphyrinogen-3 oxidase
LPVARGIELDEDDRLRRAVIGRLMCDGEIDLRQIGAEHGVDAPAYFETELATIDELGELVSHDARLQTLHATDLGRLLIRNVCMVFDRYNPDGVAGATAPRFSPTI